MADAYNEDNSIAPEHAAAKIGDKIATLGKASGLTAFGLFGTSPIAAGMVAVGDGMKAADAFVHGNAGKGAKLLVEGAVEAGVVFANGVLLGVGDIASLLVNQKFLATNAGEAVGSLLDGIDKNTRTHSATAGVGYTGGQNLASAPPDTPREMAQDNTPPYGMQAPEGGWVNYVQGRRGVAPEMDAPGQDGGRQVTSGNPRFASAVEVARQAAQQNDSQLGTT